MFLIRALTHAYLVIRTHLNPGWFRSFNAYECEYRAKTKLLKLIEFFETLSIDVCEITQDMRCITHNVQTGLVTSMAQ